MEKEWFELFFINYPCDLARQCNPIKRQGGRRLNDTQAAENIEKLIKFTGNASLSLFLCLPLLLLALNSRLTSGFLR